MKTNFENAEEVFFFSLSHEIQAFKIIVLLWTLKKKKSFKLKAEQLFLCSRQFVLFLSRGNKFELNGKRAVSNEQNNNSLPMEDPHCLSGQPVDNYRHNKSPICTGMNELHFLHPILFMSNSFQLFL